MSSIVVNTRTKQQKSGNYEPPIVAVKTLGKTNTHETQNTYALLEMIKGAKTRKIRGKRRVSLARGSKEQNVACNKGELF